MKYYVRTLKEVRTVVEYEIEAESLQEARNIAYDLNEEDGNLEKHIIFMKLWI